jgi:hypothetical protein
VLNITFIRTENINLALALRARHALQHRLVLHVEAALAAVPAALCLRVLHRLPRALRVLRRHAEAVHVAYLARLAATQLVRIEPEDHLRVVQREPAVKA